MKPRSKALPSRSPRPLLVAGLLLSVVVVGTTCIVTAIIRHPSLSPKSSTLLEAASLVFIGVLAYLLRRLLLVLNATRRGTVEITADETVTAEVLSEFAKELAAVQLSSPSKVPGESSPQNFLSDVRAAAIQGKSNWALLLLAVSTFFGLTAYKVSCIVPNEEMQNRKTIEIEISSRIGKEVRVAIISDINWERVARKAACEVAAYVLPRTALSKTALDPMASRPTRSKALFPLL